MIVVVTSSSLGRLLQQPEGDEEGLKNSFQKLFDWLKKHACRLQPTFPGTDAENLLVYFNLVCETEIKDDDIVALRKLPGIDGAYRKGAEELPA